MSFIYHQLTKAATSSLYATANLIGTGVSSIPQGCRMAFNSPIAQAARKNLNIINVVKDSDSDNPWTRLRAATVITPITACAFTNYIPETLANSGFGLALKASLVALTAVNWLKVPFAPEKNTEDKHPLADNPNQLLRKLTECTERLENFEEKQSARITAEQNQPHQAPKAQQAAETAARQALNTAIKALLDKVSQNPKADTYVIDEDSDVNTFKDWLTAALNAIKKETQKKDFNVYVDVSTISTAIQDALTDITDFKKKPIRFQSDSEWKILKHRVAMWFDTPMRSSGNFYNNLQRRFWTEISWWRRTTKTDNANLLENRANTLIQRVAVIGEPEVEVTLVSHGLKTVISAVRDFSGNLLRFTQA